jgi:uncharacterized protein (DUF111 family)
LRARRHRSPAYEIERIGYGAGTKEFRRPSERPAHHHGPRERPFATDDLVEICANIDDLNPQIYGHLSDRLFAAGARDVTLTPAIMKKGPPRGDANGISPRAAARDRTSRK